jgi:hypothetical protein
MLFCLGRQHLDLVFYWLPLARFVVGQNNSRVLAHIKYHAEQMK